MFPRLGMAGTFTPSKLWTRGKDESPEPSKAQMGAFFPVCTTSTSSDAHPSCNRRKWIMEEESVRRLDSEQQKVEEPRGNSTKHSTRPAVHDRVVPHFQTWDTPIRASPARASVLLGMPRQADRIPSGVRKKKASGRETIPPSSPPARGPMSTTQKKAPFKHPEWMPAGVVCLSNLAIDHARLSESTTPHARTRTASKQREAWSATFTTASLLTVDHKASVHHTVAATA